MAEEYSRQPSNPPTLYPSRPSPRPSQTHPPPLTPSPAPFTSL